MSTSDQVILVDEHDHPIGVMDKLEAHRGLGQLHRASSVLLFNDQGQVLVQQRSNLKIVGAGQWANTCCGNVRPGESYEACAHRRLQEELGIEGVTLKEVHKFIYQTPCNDDFSEYEMDTVFIGHFNGQAKPNPEEVKTWKWENWDQFLAKVDSAEAIYVPWVAIMKDRGILQQVHDQLHDF